MATMLFGFVEIELQYTKERQAAGFAAARKRGVYTGCKKGTTKAKPERIRELKANGLTAKEITNALGISERTVVR